MGGGGGFGRGGCRGKGGLIESKYKHFTVGCMCMFFVHPLLCEANTPPRRISFFSNLISTLEVTFQINIETFTACSQKQEEGNFACKRCDRYLLLPALLFLIQASLFTQSQRKEKMLQGLPDPPPLHPTLMRNHMTCDANTSGWADPLHPPLPSTPAQNPGRNWREARSAAAGAM